MPVKILLPSVVASLAVSLAGCTTLTPTEDPVYLKMTDLEARMIRIERVFENQSLIQLASDLDRLKTETVALRGEIETLRRETENSDGRQRELYVDVDQRLQTLEQAARTGGGSPQGRQGGFEPSPAPGGFEQRPAPAAQAAPPPPPVTEPAPAATPVAARPTGTDQQNYQAAFEIIQARRYPEASRAFTEFLAAFPTSPLADNAQYWLGETHYAQADFQGALTEFKKVIDNFPQSQKLPDALLKIGYCEDELDNDSAARASLQQVMRQYPDTTAARLASQRLERLSQ
jgi:tol-pal system protein YbgF